MRCRYCPSRCRRDGRTQYGVQRYKCGRCGKSFCEQRPRIGNMYTPFDRACEVATLLAEGSSVSSAARVAGLQDRTVLSLLEHVGSGCREFLRERVRNIDVSHLEVDEVWTFVGKKQASLGPEDDDAAMGDAYCYIALDRATRLVVAWHLGKRDMPNTARFILNVRRATSGKRFQISSDGWEPYEHAIELGLLDRASYARIVKVTNPGRVESVFGSPDTSQTETTYVERFNGTLRTWCKRYARKTYAFSRKWRMLDAALALSVAHYNFCRVQRTLGVTPAMAAGVARAPWTMQDLLRAACLRQER